MARVGMGLISRNTSQHLDADYSHFVLYLSVLITPHYQESVTMEAASLHPSGVKEQRRGSNFAGMMETSGNALGFNMSACIE